jgi:hypothetical protein
MPEAATAMDFERSIFVSCLEWPVQGQCPIAVFIMIMALA